MNVNTSYDRRPLYYHCMIEQATSGEPHKFRVIEKQFDDKTGLQVGATIIHVDEERFSVCVDKYHLITALPLVRI